MIYILSLLVIFVLYAFTNKRYRKYYVFFKTLRRDIRLVSLYFLLLLNMQRNIFTKQTVPKMFTRLASKHPYKVALYFEEEIWTYREVERFSNRIAHFFKKRGYKKGDAIALFLENKPEYVCIWLGLAKIGVITALINTNLVADPLVHSIKAADSKGVIYGSAMRKRIENISPKLVNTKLYEFVETEKEVLDGATDLRTELESCSVASPIEEIAKGEITDRVLFIYTSGTTGLPKAAIITHMRYMFICLCIKIFGRLTQDDILYDPLPLYHNSGVILGVGQSILNGCSVVIRRKFSASSFWKDCIRFKCTAVLYIGEMCRYLLAAHSKDDKIIFHNVKKFMGNGLRPQIWTQFVSRFKIEQILELYGATEGSTSLINIDGTPGAIGSCPKWASFFYPIALVKCDEATGALIKGRDGFCQRCEVGEPGILIGKIYKKTLTDFTGYVNKKASEEKLLKNVFKKGDVYFNSGDILVEDEFGYFYFRDRTGDTFRWKGENVSTSEVEAVISNILNFEDAVVYGVEVPGTEGRAGMVALVDSSSTLDMKKFAETLKENLPFYSIPLFVRLMQSIPLTGTFKLQKTDLQREGFNVDTIKEKVFLYSARSTDYVELTKEKYSDIMTGKILL